MYDPKFNIPFPLPIQWILMQALVALLILSYPIQDFYGFGSQILLRTKKVGIWWVSKCIWNLITVLLFYVLGFLVTCIFSACQGHLSFQPNPEISFRYSFVNLEGISQNEILILVLLLPVLTSVALSFAQMLFSFLLTPLYSYLLTLCFILVSTYCYSPLLSPNFSMLLRYETLSPSGFTIPAALAVNLGMIGISAVAGYFYCSHCDIFVNKKRG